MNNKKLFLTGLTASSLMLVGCGSDSNSPAQVSKNCEASLMTLTQKGDAFETVQLGTCTAAEPAWAYFDLDTGELTDESGEWDIAVKRMDVKVNDSLTSAVVVAQDHYYDGEGKPLEGEFVYAHGQTELDSFLSATTVSAEDYVSTAVEPAIKNDDWYQYQYPGGFTALDDNYWVIGSSEGEGTFALMHAANISSAYIATFKFYVEQVGAGQFSDTALSVDVSLVEVAETCVDFQSQSTITCSSGAWDVKVDIKDKNYKVLLNGGASGEGYAKAYGPVSVDEYTTGTTQGLSFAMKADSLASAFADHSPWAYGADSNSPHSVLPNYRVYAVNFGDEREVVKIQLTNYYNELGESGQITMRYMSLSDDGQ